MAGYLTPKCAEVEELCHQVHLRAPVGREQRSFTKEELLESITTTEVEEVSSCVFLKIQSFLLLEMEGIEHS